MAVPRGRNGEEEEEEALFEQEFEFEDSNSVPPHLLNLFHAAENGNLDALRHALGKLSFLSSICILWMFIGASNSWKGLFFWLWFTRWPGGSAGVEVN